MNSGQKISAKAIIEHDGKILLLREAAGGNKGKYHFPGGVVGKDEDLIAGLRREISEETGLKQLEIGEAYFECEWQSGGNLVRGIFYPVQTTSTKISLSSEHSEYIWLPLNEYQDFLDQMVDLSDEIISNYLEFRKKK